MKPIRKTPPDLPLVHMLKSFVPRVFGGDFLSSGQESRLVSEFWSAPPSDLIVTRFLYPLP